MRLHVDGTGIPGFRRMPWSGPAQVAPSCAGAPAGRERRRRGVVNRARRWLYGILLNYALTARAGALMPSGPPATPPRARSAAELDAVPRERLPPLEALRPAADDRDERGTLMRFAVPVPVRIAPDTGGHWERLSSGGWLWRAMIEGDGAASLNLHFDRLRLPAGASMVVYDPAGAMLHGPYGPASAATGELWTPLVPGGAVVVDVTVPEAGRDALSLRIAQVGYGYRSLDSTAAANANCLMDLACDAAAGWRDEARAVVRLTVEGIYLCSGTLVNNTARDGAPYVLTANHCIPDAARAASVVAYWNYQASACNGMPDGSLAQARSGATFVAGDAASDFTLIRLTRAPDPQWNARYAGWDNRPLLPVGVVAIHHPSGMEKRISIDTDVPRATLAFGDDADGRGDFLMVAAWDTGATAPGSSGGGLWNSEHRLVGQLSGGYSSCLAGGADWFGRLSSAWDGAASPDAAARLRPHLDPLGSGATTLDGADARELSVPPEQAPASARSGGGAWTPDRALSLVLLARWLFGMQAARRLAAARAASAGC